MEDRPMFPRILFNEKVANVPEELEVVIIGENKLTGY